MIIKILINPDGDGYHAYCPSLSGCHVYGKDYQEALKNCCDAMVAYLNSMEKHGDVWLNEMGLKIENDNS